MSNQKGFAHLLLLLVVVVIAAVALLYFLSNSTQFSKYIPESIRPFVKSTDTAPKAEYQNPLDKESQYANPFSENKNPFDSL